MKNMLTTKPRWVFLILAFLGLGLQTYADTEPNNTLATAENAAFGAKVTGSLNQAPLGDTDDNYLIVAPSDGNITIAADIGSGLNVNLYISDEAGGGAVGNYLTGGNSGSATKNCNATDALAVSINHTGSGGTYSFTARHVEITIRFNMPNCILSLV